MTFAAAGAQQSRRGSSNAPSERGLCATLPGASALDVVSSGERAAFARYTACGRQDTSHSQTDLIASRAVVYAAPHTAVEREGWYTTNNALQLRRVIPVAEGQRSMAVLVGSKQLARIQGDDAPECITEVLLSLPE